MEDVFDIEDTSGFTFGLQEAIHGFPMNAKLHTIWITGKIVDKIGNFISKFPDAIEGFIESGYSPDWEAYKSETVDEYASLLEDGSDKGDIWSDTLVKLESEMDNTLRKFLKPFMSASVQENQLKEQS